MKKTTFAMMMLAMSPSLAMAQRIQQKLGRSVVAVTDNATGVLVSWRKLAQEPEYCTYNIYTRKKGSTDYTKLNATPVSKTNYRTSTTAIPFDTEIAVTTVVGDVESEKSNPFLFKNNDYKDAFFNFNFETKVLTPNNYKAKYAWPMDLDGNGEFDAILVDRLYCGDGSVSDPGCSTKSHKLQAYKLDGTCLWTIDVGPNIEIDGGQNDMVLAYDIDCDGKCEVIIKSSDRTRFWNSTDNTWGKYANGSSVADTDGDGISDYTTQSKRNPPFYVSVVDAKTGEEKYCSELKYSEVHDGADQYGRDNRSDYMSDNNGTEYAFMGGHFAICYFDGIHPSLAMECLDRTTNKTHHNYVFAWSFDWNAGKPSNWHHSYTWSRNDKSPWPAEFHQLRVADMDGDGIDEMVEGGYAVNPKKGMVMSAGIGHGDRFDVSDIDPDHPGMEVFAIQQSNLMGQVIYDAKTGEHLKEWYLPTITDVGRGRCMDVDGDHKGYEVFSLLGGLYDCKGNLITEGSTAYPYEGMWWDGDLQREQLSSPGGSGYGSNAMITKYNGSRLIEFSKQSNWAVHAGWAVRPAYMGDMTGDWREEVVLMKQDANTSTGLVGYSTDILTNYSLYTLQEDPHYRLDCTTRGYYQMPCTSFYLGGDMPYPPLPPTMVTDLRWAKGSAWSAGGSGFTTFDQTASQTFADGKSVVFDLSGDNSQAISLNGALKPKAVYLMNPSGHDYTFNGSGSFAGDMELWKSMLGTATFNTSLKHTGKTVVSEGTLEVNGTIAGPVDLRAKGTLKGVCTLSDSISFEEALNYEGCRLMPGNSSTPYGVITFAKSLTLPGDVYLELNVGSQQSSSIHVEGDLTLEGTNTLTINITDSKLAEGRYTLASCTGKLTADIKSLSTRGLEGINYDLVTEDNKLVLVVNGTRDPMSGVTWTGSESSVWDYKSNNFSTSEGHTPFVSGDEVVFNDQTGNRNVTVNEMMVTGGVTIDTPEGVTYTFSGEGGISGTGSLTKTGKGEVKMSLDNNDYTGATNINGGTLTVTSIANGGTKSGLGAAAATAGNLNINGGTLKVNADNSVTDRVINLTDTATINVASGSLSLKGKVQGTSGYLVKDGNGQLNFNYEGTNTFKGLILKKGTVSHSTYKSTFGQLGGPMLLAGGKLKLVANQSMSTIPEFRYVATVKEGTSSTIEGSYRCYINGSFKGTGSLTIISTGVRSDIGSNFANFEGTLNVEGSNFRLMSGVTDMKKTTVVMAESSVMGHYKGGGADQISATTKIGALASTKDCTLGHSSDAFEVGYLGTDATFSGTLKAKTVTKAGSGIWTITNTASTSNLEVSGGQLCLNNDPFKTTPAAITTGSLTVKNGGTLSGNGAATTLTVQRGGTVSPLFKDNTATLRLLGNATFQAGSTLALSVKKKSSTTIGTSKLKLWGTVTHTNDTILINVDEDCALTAGKELEFFTYKDEGKQTGSYILKTVSPGQEITWDDSKLLSDGILTVVSVTSSIKGLSLSDDTEVDVYSTDGIKLRDNVKFGKALDGLAKGVYVINGRKVVKRF